MCLILVLGTSYILDVNKLEYACKRCPDSSVAQQEDVYMGVWSRYLRRRMCWSLGIDVCARVVFAYFKDHARIGHLKLTWAHMWGCFFSARSPNLRTVCARPIFIELGLVWLYYRASINILFHSY
jgi:hypothetical protein